jgi:hypothetical protein
MDLELAQKLASHNDELRLNKDYSGRGMCGETTTGIVGSHVDLYHAVESYLQENETNIEVDELIEDFKSDSLGMDFIWY